jgi:hypothetical protein
MTGSAFRQHERIIELLGTGLSVSTVASAVGVYAEHISRMLSSPDIAAKVSELRTIALTAATARDHKIDEIEDSLIEKVKELVDSGMIYKPRDVLATFSVINRAARRGIPPKESININQTVVQLNLPTAITKNFTLNPQGEVVDVETENGERKTLVTMPSHTLLQNLVRSKVEEKDGKGARLYERVGNYLPAYKTQGGGK